MTIGFVAIICSFVLLISAFAAVDIPFSSHDAGIQFELEESNIVTESSIDPGADQGLDILLAAFSFGKMLLAPLAILWIVWAGVVIISAGGDEEVVTKGRRQMIFSLVALALVMLSEPLVVDVFYGGGEVSSQLQGIQQIDTAFSNFSLQISSLVEWFKALIVIIAIGYIMYSGILMIFAFGEEDDISEGRKMLIPIFFGILILVFNEIIIDEVLYDVMVAGGEVTVTTGPENVNTLIAQIVSFFQYALGVVAILALALLVYGGVLYIFSFGNEERAEAGKTTFINAGIGIFVIVISFALASSLVNFSLF